MADARLTLEVFLKSKGIKPTAAELKKLNIKWRCNSRIDTVSDEILEAMADAGCIDIGFGIETLNEDFLKKSKKNYKIEQIQKIFDKMKQLSVKKRIL